MQAGISTANAVRPMQEVMNQAQTVSGRRIRLMPLQRMSSVVEMKFSEPSNCPTQKMAMETAHSTWPGSLSGPGDLAKGAQRRVRRPSRKRRSLGYEERCYRHHEGDEGHPERHHVEVRKRHVFSAYLDRQEVIAETREGSRGQHKEDHDGAVHGHQLQVILGREHAARRAGLGQELKSRNGGVRPRQVNSHDPGQHQPDVNRHQRQRVVLLANDFMVEAEDVLPNEPRRRSVMMNSRCGHVVHGVTPQYSPV